jgi:hypothetical protein
LKDDRGHPAQATGTAPKSGWPTDVRPISLDGLDTLGVSDDGRLHWDGKEVEVRKTFSLSLLQTIYAVLTLIVAASAASAAVLTAYIDYSEWVTPKKLELAIDKPRADAPPLPPR